MSAPCIEFLQWICSQAPSLQGVEYKLLSVLGTHLLQNNSLHVEASLSDLAMLTGCGRRSVSVAVGALRTRGFLHALPTPKHLSNHYQIPWWTEFQGRAESALHRMTEAETALAPGAETALSKVSKAETALVNGAKTALGTADRAEIALPAVASNGVSGAEISKQNGGPPRPPTHSLTHSHELETVVSECEDPSSPVTTLRGLMEVSFHLRPSPRDEKFIEFLEISTRQEITRSHMLAVFRDFCRKRGGYPFELPLLTVAFEEFLRRSLLRQRHHSGPSATVFRTPEERAEAEQAEKMPPATAEQLHPYTSPEERMGELETYLREFPQHEAAPEWQGELDRLQSELQQARAVGGVS